MDTLHLVSACLSFIEQCALWGAGGGGRGRALGLQHTCIESTKARERALLRLSWVFAGCGRGHLLLRVSSTVEHPHRSCWAVAQQPTV